MRVLHFAGSYFPVPGGTTTRLANMLADAQNEHLLVVPRPTAAECPEDLNGVQAEETRGHIRVHRVDARQEAGWRGGLPVLGARFKARAFSRHVPRDAPDILHGHNPLVCALAALQFKRRQNLPMLYEAHGIMRDHSNFPVLFGPVDLLNRLHRFSMRGIVARVERRVVRAAEHLIVQTQSVGRRLTELYDLQDKPIAVIRNGVDPEEFEPTRWRAQRTPLRRKHNWGNRIVCLYAGYLDRVNGIEFLLDTLPQLTGAMRHRIKIVLLGRGPYQHKVERAAKEHGDVLDYPGLVSPARMPPYYAASDVFMIPRPPFAPAETLVPMKLLEAMAMEKTLLVSDVAAMTEVITDGKNGLVFKKGSTNDFLRKLETIAAPDARFEELGRRARQDVLHHHTWEASRQRLQAVYEAVT